MKVKILEEGQHEMVNNIAFENILSVLDHSTCSIWWVSGTTLDISKTCSTTGNRMWLVNLPYLMFRQREVDNKNKHDNEIMVSWRCESWNSELDRKHVRWGCQVVGEGKIKQGSQDPRDLGESWRENWSQWNILGRISYIEEPAEQWPHMGVL